MSTGVFGKSVPSVPSGPARDLEQGRITPEEYVEQTRRDVEKAIRESPPPKRSNGDKRDAGDRGSSRDSD